MSSPRKFSEKIALHNQKQAEETAAFEQIMNEVSKVNRHQHKSHHLQLAPTLGAYRGGSLPNVNQLNNSIDLQPMMVGATTFHTVQKPIEAHNWQPPPNCHTPQAVVPHTHQNALHNLEDIKTSGVSGRSGLVDRSYRSPRGAATHRRHDTTPYTAPYLSPPSDTSWRRTNSDSALHTSAMNPGDPFQGPSSTHSSPRRDLLDTDTLKANAWDKKSAAQNRPRSCEVPGINICPSEQNTNEVATSAPIPISNNTGSLPDLTNLHIPSPLPTPLDPEDQTYNHGGSAGNLSSSMPAQTLGIITTTNHTAGVVSPTQHSPQISPQISPQLQRRTVSNPGSPIAGAAADQRRQQFSPQLQKRAMSNPSSPIAMTSNQWQQQHSPQVNVAVIQQQQQQQQQYRDNHQSLVNTSCASPTSPASNPSYSPVASPGVPVGSPGSPAYPDAYYLQQQQETNALQQQFQEINMMQDPSVVVSQAGGIQYHPTFYGQPYSMLDGQDLQGQPNKPPPAYPNLPILTTQAQNIGIPDIIFTGVGESPPRQDLPKEISSAIGGVDHVDSFDSDPFFPETIKLDPLDIDSLHMLTDNDMVADQATEESFRLDRL